jgi:metallophosphoesterase (TIGR03767 family)
MRGTEVGRIVVVAIAAVLALPGAAGAGTTTVQRTIQDCDGDNLLEWAPGEAYLELGGAAPPASEEGCASDGGSRPRLPRSASILNFLHLTDFQVVDEESPGRVEMLDTTQRAPGLNPFSAAYRPQESLTTQVVDAMVRQVRDVVSPVTGAKPALTILTGDNADSQQFNETRWFIDVLDGRRIVPDSGIEAAVPGCDAQGFPYDDNGSVYDGVRGGGAPGPDAGYYEPDGSAGAKDDGDGYSPDRARNVAEVPGPHADVTVRDFPGLLEAAQQPFEAVGLGMPWYSAFGNHDALVQGNSPDAYVGPFAGSPEKVDPAFDAIVRGCLKPSRLPTGVSPADFAAHPDQYLLASDPVVVPPDPRRCHLAKDEPNDAAFPCSTGGWIQQHDRTSGYPRGHGFEPFRTDGQSGDGRPASARLNHDGYYAFRPRPGLRFLVLDTITDECGATVCSEGSVDDTQFRWLDAQLTAADAAREYAMVFSHHTLRTTRMASIDPSEAPIHFGERLDRRPTPPRPVQPASPPDSTLEDLYCRHPSMLAHLDGHEHEAYVLQHRCEDPGQGPNRFWEVSTPAHIDWPQQSRMVELVNAGGRLSMVLTIIDHAGAPDPGAGAANGDPVRLASIAREISYNDYQMGRGSRGSRADRNVIVPLGKPWTR